MSSTALHQTDLGAFYAHHSAWLQNWLWRRTRCPERAADLAQDTFSRLLERRCQLPSDARPFLATVARRILIDDVRRRDVERAYLDAYALLSGDADYLDPAAHAEGIQLLAMIVRLLEDLPVKSRTAFLRVRFDRASYAEVAAELGLSISMTKRHVARAYAHCFSLVYAD